MSFETVEFFRDSGCRAYVVYGNNGKYFLRITKPMFAETTARSLDIHLYLQNHSYSVPRIYYTKDNRPSIQIQSSEGLHHYILYEYVDGSEVDPQKDAELIGAFLGQLHSIMQGYTGDLIKHDKHYYLDRYIQILHAKGYEKTNEFLDYGNRLWNRVKDLPRGYCHGDMYSGNILKRKDGQLFLLDFDTSSEGFPMYDPTLICTINDYFELEDDGYTKSIAVFQRFLSEYQKYSHLTEGEIAAFGDFIGLYHFALQATIIEIFGLDCVDHAFLDRQLLWLYKWRDLYEKK